MRKRRGRKRRRKRRRRDGRKQRRRNQKRQCSARYRCHCTCYAFRRVCYALCCACYASVLLFPGKQDWRSELACTKNNQF